MTTWLDRGRGIALSVGLDEAVRRFARDFGPFVLAGVALKLRTAPMACASSRNIL
jgi:hypothetical protein